jgi:hypothetical protein
MHHPVGDGLYAYRTRVYGLDSGRENDDFMSDSKLADDWGDSLKLGELHGASNGVIRDAGCSLPQMLVP